MEPISVRVDVVAFLELGGGADDLIRQLSEAVAVAAPNVLPCRETLRRPGALASVDLVDFVFKHADRAAVLTVLGYVLRTLREYVKARNIPIKVKFGKNTIEVPPGFSADEVARIIGNIEGKGVESEYEILPGNKST